MLMKPSIWVLAAIGIAAAAGCTRPQVPQTVVDPYANMGGVAVYQGDLGPGNGTAEYFRTQVGDTVLFSADQTSLTSEARAQLAKQAEWLKQHTDFAARIEGHADEKGTREYNLALGARRASSVQEYLILQGVEAGRLRINSLGKERPLEVCSTEVCFERNRRAVTVVSQGAGA